LKVWAGIPKAPRLAGLQEYGLFSSSDRFSAPENHLKLERSGRRREGSLKVLGRLCHSVDFWAGQSIL